MMTTHLLTPTTPKHALRHAKVAAILLTAFVALLLIVQQTAPTEFDRALAREIQAIPWGSFAFIPSWGSEIGGGLIGFYVAPVLLAATLASLRRWRLLLLLLGVVVLHFALISPKLFIEAYRPSPRFGVEGGGGLSSFPSGHVQWAVSFWGFVALLAWRFASERWRPAILVAYPTLVASAMLGRIELGKHWPVDTLAGLIAGLIALNLVIVAQVWLHPAPRPATLPVQSSHYPPRTANPPRPQSRTDFVG